MHIYSVGQPYDARRRQWAEGADYNFRRGEHELRIFLRGATPKEVAALESAPVSFGLLIDPRGLMLVARFGRSLSFDTSFWYHRVPAGDRTPPPEDDPARPESRALVHIVAVEATTGIILVLRAVTFSPEFTRAIHTAIADQAARPDDRERHDAWALSMMRLTSEQIWDRTTVRCEGGA